MSCKLLEKHGASDGRGSSGPVDLEAAQFCSNWFARAELIQKAVDPSALSADEAVALLKLGKFGPVRQWREKYAMGESAESVHPCIAWALAALGAGFKSIEDLASRPLPLCVHSSQ
eukprot:7695120-Pyramimonas_sp.AAC.1